MQLHIVEGKDRLEQLGTELHLDVRRTVGIMIQMCKRLFSTGKSVIMNRGFCVVNGIVALAAKGVYAGALINKRWH